MRVTDCIARIEAVADPARAASWDRCGVQIAGTVAGCTRLAVALDPLPGLIEQALDWGAQLILTHHPLTLAPRLPDRVDDLHRVLTLVLGRGATLYSAHTSLDMVTDGPAGWLAEALELANRRILEPAGCVPFVSLRFVLPQGTVETEAAAALSDMAALPGVTAVRPAPDAIEAICPRAMRGPVLAALGKALPGAKLAATAELAEPCTPYGYGLVGDLPRPLSGEALLARLGTLLDRSFFTLAGRLPASVGRLAYCPGSGADMAGRAFAAGADVFVTGDLKYHLAQVVPADKCLVDVGHFSLEEVMLRRFAADLAASLGPDGPEVRYFAGRDPITAHFPVGTAAPRTQ